jgi:hypothetical protein
VSVLNVINRVHSNTECPRHKRAQWPKRGDPNWVKVHRHKTNLMVQGHQPASVSGPIVIVGGVSIHTEHMPVQRSSDKALVWYDICTQREKLGNSLHCNAYPVHQLAAALCICSHTCDAEDDDEWCKVISLRLCSTPGRWGESPGKDRTPPC